MLRIALTDVDLTRVRVSTRVAPMLELRTLLREPVVAQASGPARADLEAVRALVAQPCAPGFLFPTTADAAEAVDTVAGARRGAIRRDLEDNAAAGFPLPAWTADLTLPGRAGTAARGDLQTALARVTSTLIEPSTRRSGAAVEARARSWRETAATRGVRAMLNGLHRAIRCRGSVLEIDLQSGADVSAATAGAGIRVVPTLLGPPGATLGSDGETPLVLTCPVDVSTAQAWDAPPDPALDDLIGPSRALLLRLVATSPGRGTRDLARRTGLAPASVSEHAAVLRCAGLVDTVRVGRRVAHHVTPLGWALLSR